MSDKLTIEQALLEAADTLECLRRGHGIEAGAACVETLNKIRPVVDNILRNKHSLDELTAETERLGLYDEPTER
jgi:hypothetical protein